MKRTISFVLFTVLLLNTALPVFAAEKSDYSKIKNMDYDRLVLSIEEETDDEMVTLLKMERAKQDNKVIKDKNFIKEYEKALKNDELDKFYAKYSDYIYTSERPLTQNEFEQIQNIPSVKILIQTTNATVNDFYVHESESFSNYTMDSASGTYSNLLYTVVNIAIATESTIVSIATSLAGVISSSDARYYSETLEKTEVDRHLMNKAIKGPDGKTYCFADRLDEANKVEFTQWVNGDVEYNDDYLGIVQKRYHPMFSDESAMTNEAVQAYNQGSYPNVPIYNYNDSGAIDWRKDLSNWY